MGNFSNRLVRSKSMRKVKSGVVDDSNILWEKVSDAEYIKIYGAEAMIQIESEEEDSPNFGATASKCCKKKKKKKEKPVIGFDKYYYSV